MNLYAITALAVQVYLVSLDYVLPSRKYAMTLRQLTELSDSEQKLKCIESFSYLFKFFFSSFITGSH